jgi:hypothetical protein
MANLGIEELLQKKFEERKEIKTAEERGWCAGYEGLENQNPFSKKELYRLWLAYELGYYDGLQVKEKLK